MKYTILINQYGIVKAGLEKKTDLVDWAIIDYLQQWYFAERKKTIFVQEKGINYVWINYKHLIEEMPMLGINDKDALTKRSKKLKELGLIDTFQTKDNTLYFILTPKCIEIIGFSSDIKDLSDQNGTGYPTAVGQGYPTAIGQHKHITNKNTTNKYSLAEDKSSANGNEKTKPKNSAKETDIRVSPVLKKFYETFKENVGTEPTKAALNFGRDGKRIKELPESYTVELLTECIDKFFVAPGFIRKNCSFTDFIAALPRLVKNDYQEGGQSHARTKWRPAIEPSESWDDWQS